VTAARTILEHAFKAIEVTDVLERIEAQEQGMEDAAK
jgi:hypothetical protein